MLIRKKMTVALLGVMMVSGTASANFTLTSSQSGLVGGLLARVVSYGVNKHGGLTKGQSLGLGCGVLALSAAAAKGKKLDLSEYLLGGIVTYVVTLYILPVEDQKEDQDFEKFASRIRRYT